MRIAFVTGCLEPGRDGVGDYVRRLAEECARRGHEVALLSVAEPWAAGENEASRGRVRRVTLAEWRADGGRAARRWLDEFRPEWVSLHFVPYSFARRGFFGGAIGPLVRTLGAARRRQILFHEIWIGSHVGARLTARAAGCWQRRAVQRLLRELAPDCVHTTVGYYQAALASLGQPAAILPMFGSVPRVDLPPVRAWPGVTPGALVCGHFGTLHPDWQSEAFLTDFAALAAARGRPPALVAVGGLGYGEARFAELAEAWRGRVDLVAAGRMTAPELSRAFAGFDFAVSTVPWNLRGKSSAAAALREHGLRVVVTAEGRPPRFARGLPVEAAADDGFVPYFRSHDALAAALETTSPDGGVRAVAERFLAELDECR